MTLFLADPKESSNAIPWNNSTTHEAKKGTCSIVKALLYLKGDI